MLLSKCSGSVAYNVYAWSRMDDNDNVPSGGFTWVRIEYVYEVGLKKVFLILCASVWVRGCPHEVCRPRGTGPTVSLWYRVVLGIWRNCALVCSGCRRMLACQACVSVWLTRCSMYAEVYCPTGSLPGYMYIYIYCSTSISASTYVAVCVDRCLSICISIYVYMYVCIYVDIYVYVSLSDPK